MRGRGILGLLLFCSSVCYGWQVRPSGKFHSDSIRIGEETLYSLSVTYPINQDIVFPDSLFDFSPFEFNSKDYFFTRSDSLFSFDSAVYNLSTFEVDSVQILSLPIWVITSNDSLAYFARPDTLILSHVVTQIPDSLAFIDNTIYKEVNYAFNYPYFIIGTVVVLIIVALFIFFFGKSVMKRYQLYRLGRMHQKFMKSYKNLIDSQKHDWEKSLLEWKLYMEKLEEKPYTRLTTKEIARKTNDSLLLNALKGIDRTIYGRTGKESGNKYFEDLVSFARNAYSDKVKKIKYGADG